MGVLMLHASSFIAVAVPTPGMLTSPVKLNMTSMGAAWNLTLTWDTVTAAGSLMLGIGSGLRACVHWGS